MFGSADGDSVLRMLIRVTEQDILDGVPRTVASCPVALAISRTLNTGRVKVCEGKIHLKGKVLMAYPKSVRSFIDRYDLPGGRLPLCKPFNFYLNIDPVNLLTFPRR